MIRYEFPKAAAYMERALMKKAEVDRMAKRLEGLRTLAESTTSRLSDTPRSDSPNKQRMEDVALRIVDLERDMESANAALEDIRCELTVNLGEWLDADAAEIMAMRYVHSMPWADIAGAYGISVATVYRVHRTSMAVIEGRLGAAVQAVSNDDT